MFSSSNTSKMRSVAVRASSSEREQEADRLHRPAQHGRHREERDELGDLQLPELRRGRCPRRGTARTRCRAAARARTRSTPIARALRSSVSRSVSACAVNFCSACLPRPNAFSTRMPCTLSSTEVARSPAWSWLWRASAAVASSRTGSRCTTAARARRGRSCRAASASGTAARVPTTIVITLTTSSTTPNAIQRRSMLMSCIMRLSSCPDCHRSWNDTGRRCRRE